MANPRNLEEHWSSLASWELCFPGLDLSERRGSTASTLTFDSTETLGSFTGPTTPVTSCQYPTESFDPSGELFQAVHGVSGMDVYGGFNVRPIDFNATIHQTWIPPALPEAAKGPPFGLKPSPIANVCKFSDIQAADSSYQPPPCDDIMIVKSEDSIIKNEGTDQAPILIMGSDDAIAGHTATAPFANHVIAPTSLQNNPTVACWSDQNQGVLQNLCFDFDFHRSRGTPEGSSPSENFTFVDSVSASADETDEMMEDVPVEPQPEALSTRRQNSDCKSTGVLGWSTVCSHVCVALKRGEDKEAHIEKRADGKWYCTMFFKRQEHFKRHLKGDRHNPKAKTLFCPIYGCPKSKNPPGGKQPNGFAADRQDNLNAHIENTHCAVEDVNRKTNKRNKQATPKEIANLGWEGYKESAERKAQQKKVKEMLKPKDGRRPATVNEIVAYFENHKIIWSERELLKLLNNPQLTVMLKARGHVANVGMRSSKLSAGSMRVRKTASKTARLKPARNRVTDIPLD